MVSPSQKAVVAGEVEEAAEAISAMLRSSSHQGLGICLNCFCHTGMAVAGIVMS